MPSFTFSRLCLAAAALLGLQLASAAAPLPPGSPKETGFSPDGLLRIDQFFEREINAGRMPGAVLAIARNGRLVHYKAYGKISGASDAAPMPLDAIFPLASMTKVMVSVGALTLNEEGRLPLKSRLSDYLPQFAKMQVGDQPATPIYIQDLMRHTSGIPYGSSGESAAYKAFPNSSTGSALEMSGDAFLAKLASTPLLHQPGTVFEYGLSTDVLGLVVEKISGKRLGDFLAKAVWEKVSMPDTAFGAVNVSRKRFALPFVKDPLTGREQPFPFFDKAIQFDCGGGCAVATVGDYLRFGQMLLNGGSLDGKRVLSPYSVRALTSDHLGSQIRNNVVAVDPHREGYGFGLGVAVRLQDGIAAVPGSAGDYTWNGAFGTAYWADPKERLVVVMGAMTPGPVRKHYRDQLGALVYGAMLALPPPSK